MRLLAPIAVLLFAASAIAQLDSVGASRVYSTGRGEIPTRAGYVGPGATISITTRTSPVASGQSVVAVVSTDGFATSREIPLSFDFNSGNETQWYTVLGPYAPGTTARWYLRANGSGGAVRYDNNGGLDFGATWRRAPSERRGAILQWFATDYRTMLKRLPQVVAAGYGALYLPPPQKSGGGGFSVGYNPFDRFDLGDRLQLGTVPTRYGTTQELIELVRAAHRYGLEVVADLVPNHNDNRASTAIDRYPDMIPEDFHIRSSADTSNPEIDFNTAQPLSREMQDNDLVGLADIAQEDGNRARTGAFTLPPYATFDAFGKPTFVRNPLTPQYYPGGNPVSEDVRSYLRRWVWFLTTQIGFDGFRVDAAKHMPPAFLGQAGGPAAGQAGPVVSATGLFDYLSTLKRDPLVFGEILSSNGYELREYAKTGTNLLDFPLVDRFGQVFNGNGYGDMGGFVNPPGLDPGTSLGYALGGLDRETGISFVQSHDNGPPRSNNLATALALTRPGSSLVYYDGNNLDPNDYSQFPKPGRGDALGDFGDGTTRMVDARARFARGASVTRFVTSDLLVTERQVNGVGLLLTGLNDRGDTALSATVDTAFAPATVLVDLSGQGAPLTVGSDRRVTLTVPSNSAAGNDNNARGYVLYAPETAAPLGAADPISATDESGTALAAEDVPLPRGSRSTDVRNLSTLVLTGSRLNLSVATTAIGASAFVKLDDGTFSPTYNPLRNTPEGLTDGFVALAGSGGSFTGTLDLSGAADGLRLVRVRVFNAGYPVSPGVYRDFLRWIQVRRGLGGPFQVDGDLTEFGPNANVWQSRTPSSQANRLDGLFVANDDNYLYIGVAGRVENAEGTTNGMAILLDNGQAGAGDLSVLKDDSGPAPRLLSNSRLTLPSGFRPAYAVASFRGGTLGSAPEAATPGSPAAPPSVGAFAGTFRLDPSAPTRLGPILSAIAYQPRTTPTSTPYRGWEAAIPLRVLYPSLASPYASVKLLAWLGTTGEAGTILRASDPLRGSLGGRPAPRPWVSNQLLPPQSNVTGDIGTNGASLSSVLTYALRRASTNFGIRITSTAAEVIGADSSRATLTITNATNAAVAGPIYVMVSSSRADLLRVVNRRGTSLFGWGQYLLVTEAAIPAGASVEVPVTYQGGSFRAPQVSFSAYAGRGAL